MAAFLNVQFSTKDQKIFFFKKNNPFKEKNKYLVNKPKETDQV